MEHFITPFALFYNLQTWEILLIFLVILLLFGAKKLPELAKGIGKAIHEFKRAATNAEDSFREAVDTTPKADNTQKQTTSEPSNTLKN
jgi:sec-independent protein translocase protein TatA